MIGLSPASSVLVPSTKGEGVAAVATEEEEVEVETRSSGKPINRESNTLTAFILALHFVTSYCVWCIIVSCTYVRYMRIGI